MGMIMDLQKCGHHVTVFSDAENYTELKQTWSPEVAQRYLADVKFVDGPASELSLDWYDRIVIGGKLDLLYNGSDQGLAVPGVLDELVEKGDVNHSKISVFWDDVPFERCSIRPEADQICPRVPEVVRRIESLASTFFVLSRDDKKRMLQDMDVNGIEMTRARVKIWPMRIKNMKEALPETHDIVYAEQRDLVIMIGGNHAANCMMITQLFESGAVTKICSAIEARGSPVKLKFIGGLANAVQEEMKYYPKTASCVEADAGFVSDEELKTSVYPRTRAVLNPFFEDIHSGISVKNFESIMRGVPFVTSRFGMHGLSDEVPDCNFPVPDNPEDPNDLVDFVVSKIVNETNYVKFAEHVAERAPSCIQGQLDRYPLDERCGIF